MTIFKIGIVCILILFWNLSIIMFMTLVKSLLCHAFVLPHLGTSFVLPQPYVVEITVLNR